MTLIIVFKVCIFFPYELLTALTAIEQAGFATWRGFRGELAGEISEFDPEEDH